MAVLSIHRKRMLAAALGLGAIVWVGLLAMAIDAPQITGDTRVLVAGTDAFRECLSSGRLGACPEISHFPLLQYIPSMLLRLVGVSQGATVTSLVILSCLAVLVITLLLAWVLIRRRAGGWPLALLLVLGGPFVWYATASSGEALAALAVLAFAAALLLRAPWWATLVLAVLAGISKETLIPVLVLVVLACWLVTIERPCRADLRTWVLPPAGGLVIALVANSLWNQARYGTWQNADYLQDIYRMPGWGQRAGYAVGQWVAPTQGITVVWPLLVALVISAIVVAIVWWRTALLRSLGVVAIVLALIIFSAGNGSWAFPFGGVFWGPRLMLPLLPAAAAVLCVAMGSVLPRLLRHWATVTIAGLLAAWGLLVNLGAATSAGFVLYRYFFVWKGVCEGEPVLETDPERYFSCLRHQTWTPTSTVWHAIEQAFRWPFVIVALAGLGAVVLAAVLARSEEAEGGT